MEGLLRRTDRMVKIKKTRDASFKAKVAFEAAMGQKTIAQLAS